MIDFKFQCDGKTSLMAVGDALSLSAGVAFLISQLYHKGLKPEKELFRRAVEYVVQSGFCWDEKNDIRAEGVTMDLSEIARQADPEL